MKALLLAFLYLSHPLHIPYTPHPPGVSQPPPQGLAHAHRRARPRQGASATSAARRTAVT